MAGISYYKTYCPPEIVLKNKQLTTTQARFWNNLYTRGLGEFFYTNELDFQDLIKFPVSKGFKVKALKSSLRERSLLPIGGGKDSLLSAELLQKAGEDFTLFSLNNPGPIEETARIIAKERIIVYRTLDPQLIVLNKQGAYNGHVPITAYLSFLLLTCAVLYDYKYLILSLEKSSNFGQVLYHGLDINHQYSKSEEFERDFRQYVEQFICSGIEMFSLLRPFYEIKIAQLFVDKGARYFSTFSSCNTNFKLQNPANERWCGVCPKCAFVFAIFSAFMPKEKLLEIFGKNLYANPELLETYRELLGLVGIKPFECVGTDEEVQLALYLAHNRGEYEEDPVMQMFVAELLPSLQLEKLQEKLLQTYEHDLLPERFRKIL